MATSNSSKVASLHGGEEKLVALVVDDSVAVRELLAAVLEANGVSHVLQAGDGADALGQMASYPYPINIAFCDLEMPGMDGADMLRHIALAHQNTAIVVFSGLEPRLLRTVADMADGLGLEVLGVLGKPFSEAEIQSLLTRYRQARVRQARISTAELTAGEIESALREDRIEVYYQPKARMSDGETVGVEALVRLRHPHLGIIGPACFIPVAEACNLINGLTQRVLEKALAQAGEWLRAGLELNVAINLSPSTLRQLDLPDVIAKLAARHGIPPRLITLELTEDRGSLDPAMLQSISRLRLKGFHLGIDDFGTGDSGLYRLKSLPFSELKIDRGFVNEAEHREDLRSVLETSVGLGHRLHLSVVAEGVEKWTQWHFLEKASCDQAQGFLISPALPARSLPEALEKWKLRLRNETAREHKEQVRLVASRS